MTVQRGYGGIPKRYLVTALAFVGCFSMYNLRTTLGIALVEMTSEKTIVIGNRTERIVSPFSHTVVVRAYIRGFANDSAYSFPESRIRVGFGSAGVHPQRVRDREFLHLRLQFSRGQTRRCDHLRIGDIAECHSEPVDANAPSSSREPVPRR